MMPARKALFAFAYGTNPEVLVLLECRETASKPGEWQVGFGRLGAARSEVSADGVVLWQCDDVTTWSETDPYFSAFGPEEIEEPR